MPRSRGSELPQRASPRAPLHLKTTASSEANGAHHRLLVDRSSPKVADRHSPRSPLPEKKRAGTRVAELETKLGKVQDVEVEETKTMIEEDKKDSAAAIEGGEKENPEVVELKAQLIAKEMEVAVLTADNAELKKQADEAAAAVKRADEEAVAKAFLIEQELKENAAREARMGEQLRASEAAREALDAEMRRLRVQTEQWRKAAEAAAAVIGGDAHLVGHHGLAGNGSNGWGSPATMPDDGDDEGFGSKRKGAGIRMLGDLWKKKGSK
ncbi:unnamed protein product [Triticum turgidum subsp. durum]|uniref:Uncharacterized protein n=1 Tax=Triticum turgidum subsp. durum TaxID=4567 RepID=A0A9R0RNX2_TRITD|nr:unnamed protein product [Triticum turgidum subsp. durum]